MQTNFLSRVLSSNGQQEGIDDTPGCDKDSATIIGEG